MMTRHGVNVREKNVGFKLLEGRSPKKKEKKKSQMDYGLFGNLEKVFTFALKVLLIFSRDHP